MKQSQSSAMSIQERIRALQSSGCCLDNNKENHHHHDSQSSSSQNRGDSIKSSSLNDSISSLDWNTITQEPLTPCDNNKSNDDGDDENNHRSAVSFADMAEVCLIPQLDETVDYDSLYYKEEELADFRHEAFLEKCGLTDMI